MMVTVWYHPDKDELALIDELVSIGNIGFFMTPSEMWHCYMDAIHSSGWIKIGAL